MLKRSIHFLVFTYALLSSTAVTDADELPPGAIINPEGLQLFQGAAYNSENDEYLITFQGGGIPRVRRLGVDGNFLDDVVLLDDAIGIANVGIVYNPDDNQYLAIYRSDETIFGRYLANNGLPLASRFQIGTGGSFGVAAYSRTSGRYLVVWRQGPSPVRVQYAFIDGDSTSPDPILDRGTLTTGDNPQAAWGSQNDKFLVVYTRVAGLAKEEVFGRIVEGDGSGFSGELGIMQGNKPQTSPQVGYSSINDTFLVSAEDWKRSLCCRADVTGQRIDSSGNKVGGRFNIKATGNRGWDVPGPIGFNEVTGRLIATSFVGISGFAIEVDPVTAAVDDPILVGDLVSVPIAIATRPDPVDPQALVLTRSNLGGDGVHAHILHLEIPPPTIGSTMPNGQVGVFYSQPISVAGGTAPFNFQLVPGFGTLPPGLSGPNANTGVISGTPTTPGVFGFRIQVTDNDGRVAVADLTHTIGLGAPNLTSPVSIATTDTTPTFDWAATPGATSYRLVVENITSGGTPINQSNINTTSFTPGSALPAGKLYQWKVQASGGGISSLFSGNALFEIDTKLPPPVVLSGKVPEPNAPIFDLVAIDASSELSNQKKKENLVDTKNATMWSSAGTATNVPEHVTVDLGAPFEVSRLALRSNRGPRFPKDFEIQISNQPSSGFVTLASFSGFQANSNTSHTFDVVPTMGRYVKIDITTKGFHQGKFWVEIAELSAFQMIDVMGTILYTFKAPADDAGSGTEPAVTYDLRIMETGTPFDYAAATPVAGEPVPAVPGAQQGLLVQGLDDETTYAAAITSIDDAGNRSAVSNVVVVTTAAIPPGPITGLQVVNGLATGTSIHLRWTAPPDNVGDNASGPVDHYDVRCSTSAIPNLAAFQALPIIPGPAPLPPGNTQDFDVPNRANQTNYHCGVLAIDHSGVSSDFGSTVNGSTLDAIAPNQVSNLKVKLSISSLPITAVEVSGEKNDPDFFKEKAIDGNATTLWSSPGRSAVTTEFIKLDLGSSVDMNLVRLLAPASESICFPRDFTIQLSNDDVNYTTVHTENDFVATNGTWYDFGFSSTSARYVKVEVTEQNLFFGKFYTRIAEIEVLDPSGPLIQAIVTWSASGDDGNQGTASSYEIRHSTALITADNFNGAILPPGTPPVPQAPGSLETFAIGSGLTPGVMTWFAVETTDDQGNTSVAVVSGVTPSP